MLDPDPLYVEGYAYLPIAPSCIAPSRWYTVWHRGPRARHLLMNEWLHGLVIGFALGVPVAILLGRLDRWLDVIWER